MTGVSLSMLRVWSLLRWNCRRDFACTTWAVWRQRCGLLRSQEWSTYRAIGMASLSFPPILSPLTRSCQYQSTFALLCDDKIESLRRLGVVEQSWKRSVISVRDSFSLIYSWMRKRKNPVFIPLTRLFDLKTSWNQILHRQTCVRYSLKNDKPFSMPSSITSNNIHQHDLPIK